MCDISEITGIPRSTIYSFLEVYEARGQLEVKRGRLTKITPEFEAAVADELENNPFLALKDQATQHGICPETIRKIRHKKKYDINEMTPMCPLSQQHI